MDLTALNGVIYAAHAFLATSLNQPLLNIDEKEAATLSEASCKVAAHYNIGITEKQKDWCMLFMALGAIYGPRIMMISQQKKADKRASHNEAANIPFGVVA